MVQHFSTSQLTAAYSFLNQLQFHFQFQANPLPFIISSMSLKMNKNFIQSINRNFNFSTLHKFVSPYFMLFFQFSKKKENIVPFSYHQFSITHSQGAHTYEYITHYAHCPCACVKNENEFTNFFIFFYYFQFLLYFACI